MTSVIYFRMKSAAAGRLEPIQFTGHQMKLLDLKRAIVDLKRLGGSVDFDLRITDADDESKGAYL